MTENVVINFTSDTSGLDAVNKKLNEVGTTQQRNSEIFKKTQKEEAEALIKTNGALNVLEANLRSLKDDRQKAFDPKAIKEFNIQIAESERAINKLKSAGVETKKGFDSFKAGLGDIAVALGLAFSVEKLVEFGKASVEAFKEAEKASKALEFAVKNVNKEGDAAVTMLKQLADKLSSKGNFSVFDNDDIIKAQAALATYGLTSKEIQKLLPNLINAASVTGDLTGTTDSFIKAIEGQTRGLKTLGVDFKDTGNKAENYNRLIEQTNKLTGQGAAALATAAGQAQAYENAIENLQESLGERLAPAIAKAKKALLEFASDVIDSFSSDEDNLAAKLKQSNDAKIEQFRSYNADLRKAAIEANREDAKEQLNIIEAQKTNLLVAGENATSQLKEDADKQIKVAQARLKAALDLQQQFIAALSSNTVNSNLGDTEEERKRKEAARLKEIEDEKKAREKLNAEIIALRKKLAAEIEKIEIDQTKSDIEKAKERAKLISDEEKRLQDLKVDLDKKAREKIDEAEKKQREDEQTYNNLAVQFSQTLADTTFQIASNSRNALLDENIAALEKQREKELSVKNLTEKKKKEIDEKFNKEVAKIKNDAAKKDRDAAVAQALINGALAITNILANVKGAPLSAAAIASLIISATTTAAQVAVIESQPLPKYAKGKEYIDGPGSHTSDSIVARLSKGERVVPHDVNADYFPALSAIHNRKIRPGLANSLLTNIPNMNISEEALMGALKLSASGVGMDYDKLARALGGQLDGLDDLRKLNETNQLLSIISNKLTNGIDIRRL